MKHRWVSPPLHIPSIAALSPPSLDCFLSKGMRWAVLRVQAQQKGCILLLINWFHSCISKWWVFTVTVHVKVATVLSLRWPRGAKQHFKMWSTVTKPEANIHFKTFLHIIKPNYITKTQLPVPEKKLTRQGTWTWRTDQQQCIQYFNEVHSYAVIADMMSCLHGVHISLSSLKSKLNEAGRSRYHFRVNPGFGMFPFRLVSFVNLSVSRLVNLFSEM